MNERERGVKDRIASIFIFTFSLSFIAVNTNNLEPKDYNCLKVIITILLHLRGAIKKQNRLKFGHCPNLQYPLPPSEVRTP